MIVAANLITSRDLAQKLGRSIDTINRMARTNRGMRAARFSRGLWRIDALVRASILRLT